MRNAAVHALSVEVPETFAGLVNQDISIKSKGAGNWDVRVPYGKLERKKPGDFTFSFDTGGGTAKITQRATIKSRNVEATAKREPISALNTYSEGKVTTRKGKQGRNLDDGTGAFRSVRRPRYCRAVCP